MPRGVVNLDLTFQALADPTRRGIVERLSRGRASVSELALPYPMSLPAIVQHLAVLQNSGLVRSEKTRPSADVQHGPACTQPSRAVVRPAPRAMGAALRPPR